MLSELFSQEDLSLLPHLFDNSVMYCVQTCVCVRVEILSWCRTTNLGSCGARTPDPEIKSHRFYSLSQPGPPQTCVFYFLLWVKICISRVLWRNGADGMEMYMCVCTCVSVCHGVQSQRLASPGSAGQPGAPGKMRCCSWAPKVAGGQNALTGDVSLRNIKAFNSLDEAHSPYGGGSSLLKVY